LSATSFQGYFEAIESDLVDGVNPVLSMPTAFKAMADGGLECNPVDKLPKLPAGEDSLYGVMSYDNTLSSQLVQRVMPKAQCYTEFESSLTIDGNQNCTDLAAKSYVEVGRVCRPKNNDGYVTTTVADAAACQTLCDADAKCGAWEYENYAADNRECELHEASVVDAEATALQGPCTTSDPASYRCCHIDAALVAEGAEGRRLRLRRRLAEGGGSAGGTSVLALSTLPSNGGAAVAASLASTVWLSVFASLLAGRFAC
jgi:hypothetical protein